METAGTKLRAAREARGLSLAELAEKTRINQAYLKALEEDDFGALPGEVFVSGFLRSYARELGLKEKAVMAAYREQTAAKEEPQQQTRQEAVKEAAPPGEGVRKRAVSARLAFAAVAAIALAVFLMLATGEDEPVPEMEPPPAEKAQAPAPAFSPATTSSVFEGRTTAGAASVPQAPAAVVVEKVELVLEADEESWYSYRADGGERVSGIIRAGGKLAVTADEEILVDIGNAGGVKATLNDEAMPSFGERGAVRKGLLFTRARGGVQAVRPGPAGQGSAQ